MISATLNRRKLAIKNWETGMFGSLKGLLPMGVSCESLGSRFTGEMVSLNFAI
jgi:hypothetical protein